MNAYEAILGRRTIRKFRQEKIEHTILEKLINAARVAPSASNIQPLKYIIADQKEQVGKVFENVKWAGYITPAGNPGENEKPVAFIIILADTSIRASGYELDIGAAAQNIFIAAYEEGIGTCWIGSVNRDKVREALSIPDNYAINSVIALGYAAESPVIEDEKGSIKYYKDDKGVLHVPKRRLEDIIL
jgi:nitroreductase